MTIRRALCAAMIAVFVLPAAQAADSDGDGFEDNVDNCTLIANPAQRDSNADGYGNMCDGDFSDDGVINAQDLGIMKDNFFSDNEDTDMNGDGSTNAIDLGLLKTAFFS